MTFDVGKHMDGLPLNNDRIGREIETRKLETKKLNRLKLIAKLAEMEKRLPEDETQLETQLGLVAEDISQLNQSRWAMNASGGNAEILARMVSAGILVDFPEVEEVDYDAPRRTVKWNRDNDGCISLKTGFWSEQKVPSGETVAVMTTAEFHYSASQVEERVKTLSDEIGALESFKIGLGGGRG